MSVIKAIMLDHMHSVLFDVLAETLAILFSSIPALLHEL